MERNLLFELNGLVEQAQHPLGKFRDPDSGMSQKDLVDGLFAILDGPDQRRIQEAVRQVSDDYIFPF